MHKNKKNGFTLVELLAVIVILAVILVISVPKITDTIESSRESSLEASAKTILNSAEQTLAAKLILDENYVATDMDCDLIVDINDVDYESCEVTFDDNVASINLTGKGKFEGYTCSGTKDDLNCSKGSPEPIAYYAFGTPTTSSTTKFTTLDEDVFVRLQDGVLSACINNGGDEPLCVPKDLQLGSDTYGDWTEKEKEDAFAKMEQIFGRGANCTAEPSMVGCTLGDFECVARSNGGAYCNSHFSSLYCDVYSVGSVNCN